MPSSFYLQHLNNYNCHKVIPDNNGNIIAKSKSSLKMKHSLIRTLLILSHAILMYSCKKQAPPCRGNCVSINANGIVRNKLTNAVAPNAQVSLTWVKGALIFAPREVVTTVNSNNDGTFNFTSNLDTTYFTRGYFLSLSANANAEYLVSGFSGFTETRIYTFDPNAFNRILFDIYRKANLKLRLHRILNDNFQSFSISYATVEPNSFIYNYNVQSPQEVTDRNISEINISTIADIFTKIKVEKTFANGTSVTNLDSIKCTANTTSVYDINF